MSIMFEKLFEEIRANHKFSGSDLEELYFKLIDKNRKTIKEKRDRIERTLGEITQLQAFESTLFSTLKKVISDKKGLAAEEVRTSTLMKIKKDQARERLDKAIEDDGLQPGEVEAEKVEVEKVETKKVDTSKCEVYTEPEPKQAPSEEEASEKPIPKRKIRKRKG